MLKDTITPVNSEVDNSIGGYKDSLDQDTLSKNHITPT